MKKHLPNILLYIVILANIFFMGVYIRNNGPGMFFSTTGIVFVILGIVIFIFFLSIDPGYGWTRSIDLTKNYIMIFTSMAVGIAGVVLIVIGQQMNELYVQSINDHERCRQLVSGNAAEVLKKDWYNLRDQESRERLSVYLFQKKSDRNNYKIIATSNDEESAQAVKNLTITSGAIPQTIILDNRDSACPGVFEKDISIDFDRHQKLKEQVEFDLLISISEDAVANSASNEQKKTVQFTLKNEPHESGLKPESNTQVGTRIQRHRPEFGMTVWKGQV